MSEEITVEERKKQEKITEAIKELIKNEVFQMTSKTAIMKIIRAELKKEIRESVKFYLSQVIPDSNELSEIVREEFLKLGNKYGK